MTKDKNESARHSVDRISRLERRFYQIVHSGKPTHKAEASALEWAIPILKEYVAGAYGYLPPSRYPLYKHEKEETKAYLWQRDGPMCYLCNGKMILTATTIDHVIPLSKGGRDDFTNYRLVHPTCNIQKGNLLLDDFLKAKEKAQSA